LPLKAGERLGPYEILGLIGAGGMGEVYRAKDTRLDRTVAIKVLPDDISADPDRRARFEREAKTIAALSHPHICTLFDIGRHDGTDFLVMEHLEGQTLALRLQEGALPLEDALAIGIQIAHALDKAHRAGIVHRDLKPGNIMLTKGGAKLLDFGLAKARPTAAAAAETTVLASGQVPITAQGTILGTLKYMAPEQLDGKPADTRADIWAFGCVLYEMLTGTRAFDGSSPASVIGAIMSSSPRPVQELAPVAPPLLDRIVRGCLTKDPEERVQSAHDLRNDLRWIEELGTSAARPAAPSRSPRARVLVRAASALALACVVGAAFLIGRQTRIPPEQIQFHVSAPEGLRFVTSHASRPTAAISSSSEPMHETKRICGSERLMRRRDVCFRGPKTRRSLSGLPTAAQSPSSRGSG
jgi:eukaryotic-like serine/threonine-protein kinase